MKMKGKNWGGGIPMGKDYVEINFVSSSKDCDPELRKVDTITFTLKQWAAFKLEMDHLFYYHLQNH